MKYYVVIRVFRIYWIFFDEDILKVKLKVYFILYYLFYLVILKYMCGIKSK